MDLVVLENQLHPVDLVVQLILVVLVVPVIPVDPVGRTDLVDPVVHLRH